LDGENIISWNFANWVTVLLMAFTGFAIYGLLGRVIHAQRGGDDAALAAATTA
jgi:hypothetical protein